MNILIDPGHGAHDSGAVSLDGDLMEKDVVLSVSRMIRDELDGCGKIKLSRDSDGFLTLSQRARLANRDGSYLLSIHCNAGGGHGFEVFTSPGETGSDAWATETLEQLGKEFPDRRIRSDYSDGDPDKEARFSVLTRTRHSAILVELGFIDTKEGREFLDNKCNQSRMAKAIAKACINHFATE